jgi:hypothetical protein
MIYGIKHDLLRCNLHLIIRLILSTEHLPWENQCRIGPFSTCYITYRTQRRSLIVLDLRICSLHSERWVGVLRDLQHYGRGKGMKEIFLINASYDNVSLPATCMRERAGKIRHGVWVKQTWRGNGFAYAVTGRQLLCMYHKTELWSSGHIFPGQQFDFWFWSRYDTTDWEASISVDMLALHLPKRRKTGALKQRD